MPANHRSPDLQRLIDATEAALRAGIAAAPVAGPMIDRIFDSLRSDVGNEVEDKGCRQPACGHFEAAISDAAAASPRVRELAAALADVEPRMSWYRRPGSETEHTAFHAGHANAHIVGTQGLERRHDVWIGVSLMAPALSYPRHRHPPEEVYVTLTPGNWMRDDVDLEPSAPGDIIHNPPNVWHAMRSVPDRPLLAVWCLWTGERPNS